MSDVKICKRCRWFRSGYSAFFVAREIPPYCIRPTGETDIVTGEKKKVNRPCEDERESLRTIRCGPDGRFYEPRR